MIISTNKSDMMLKRSLGKDKTIIIAIDKMLDQFSLDPTMMNPPRHAYIVTNEDISAKRLRDKFEQALQTKHPATKVIFINKSSKAVYQNGLPGLDAVLQKPKSQDITQTISAVTATTVIESAVGSQVQPTIEIPAYTPEETGNVYQEPTMPVGNPTTQDTGTQVNNGPTYTETHGGYEGSSTMGSDTPNSQSPAYEPEVLPGIDIQGYEDTTESSVVERKSASVEKIERTGMVSDAKVIMRELTATNLIKDLYESNSTYAGIEEKLKSLNDTIFNIMGDPNIKSLDEKLSKVHALLHDKAFFRAKGVTLIEQRLEEVVDAICSQTSSLLQSRLNEIDTAIKKSMTDKNMETNTARLGGLNEQRANLIIELHQLELDIADIYKSTDNLVVSTATYIAASNEDATGNEAINDMLKARGEMVVLDSVIDAIRSAMELGVGKVPETFKQLKLNIMTTLALLRKLFDVDQEIIAAQQQFINYLKTNSIESTVVAETLLKKSLRVYVGEEGVGRTIIPYLISKYKSRQNANVLLLDLTGTAKYSQYGIQYKNVDSYLLDLDQREFMLVAGKVDDSISTAQRIVTSLLKAADYYRIINVVLSPEQSELFQTIAQDVLSVNFIVDTNVPRIDRMRELMEEYVTPNVARRVIINRCDVPIRVIVDKLGLADQMDYQVCTVPSVPAIIDAGLNCYDPYGVSSVDLTMEEVVKHA